LVTRHISTAHKGGSSTIGKHLQVFVRDNNVDQALRVLKKKMQREGVFREMTSANLLRSNQSRSVGDRAPSSSAAAGRSRRASQQDRAQ
jgi:small subunit ribosomal protein S21